MIVHPVEIVLLGNLKMYLDVTIVEVTDSKTPYTAISKKVVRKKFARGNPERYYGIRSIHFSWHCRCRPYFSCFPLALATIRPWPLVPFFQISLKNGEPQTTHNTFRVCRVHFFPHSRNSCIYKADSCFCLAVRSTRYANLIIILNYKPSLSEERN